MKALYALLEIFEKAGVLDGRESTAWFEPDERAFARDFDEQPILGELPQPKLLRRRAGDAYLEITHGITMSFGAAGRSPLRDRALSQPAQAAALRISAAPVTVADKSTLTVTAGGRTFTSVWRATQARDAVTSARTESLHVVELVELPA